MRPAPDLHRATHVAVPTCLPGKKEDSEGPTRNFQVVSNQYKVQSENTSSRSVMENAAHLGVEGRQVGCLQRLGGLLQESSKEGRNQGTGLSWLPERHLVGRPEVQPPLFRDQRVPSLHT